MPSSFRSGLIRDETTGALLVTGGSAVDAKRRLWIPTGAIDESVAIRLASVTSTVVSGTLFVTGGLVVPAGQTVSSVTFRISGAAVTPTDTWMCLVRLSDRAVLAKSASDGGAAVGTGFKTMALTTPWTAVDDTAVYAGIVSVAATPVTVNGVSISALMHAAAPVLSGNSTAGLTNPASLGATAAAVTATSQMAYAYIS